MVGGGTTINGGTLAVNGTLTSNVTINKDATLAGRMNVVGEVTNNGGHIAPGNSIGTLTIDGALVINEGTLDMQIAPGGKSDKIVLTGPDGKLTFGVDTLNAIFEPGVYAPGTYTLVTTSQGVEGRIDTYSAENHPPNFISTAYNTSNEVLLTLAAALGNESVLGGAQTKLARQIDAVYNATGVLPSNFADLYGITGPALNSTLSAAIGDAATGLRPTSVQMTNAFLSLMLDPFVDGRSGAAGFGAPPVLGLANAPADGLPTRKGSAAVAQPLWSTWAAAYGGYGRVDGDPWGAGSHTVSTNAGGVVAGLDYRPAPGTVIGAAIAGAGGNWSLADGAGGGDTSALQLGLYGATHWGPVYLGGALSFTNDWASTSRGGFSQSLKANFDAQNYGGRIEAGYRMETAFGAFTPYAAGQAQSLHTPSFSEGGAFGASFASGFAGDTASNERGELGFRFDTQQPIGSNMMLAFQGKVAWAHDWFSDYDLSATFLAAPISYVATGAAPSHDLALISAGAELRLGNGISLLGKFNTELSGNSTVYAGTTTLTYHF